MNPSGAKENFKPKGIHAVFVAMKSWRTAAVTLLSFSSGLPLGLVWFAIPDWMRSEGVDIRLVGLMTLAQAPWTFKMLWSPFMDRYVPPFWGRRRGWAAITQIALAIVTLLLAGLGSHPETPWVIGALAFAIAFASASQDIAIDAYAVEVLRPEEQGIAVGARIATYRAAMFIAGGFSISLAATISWPVVFGIIAAAFLLMTVITWLAPEPEEKLVEPKSLRDAVWLPFLEALSRHRALEILSFVVLYKLADNLAGSLLRPFLIDCGYSALQRGVALSTVGMFATLGGALLGGAFTTALGLGNSLWIFGGLQMISNVGYILLANSPVNIPLMYGAMGFESFTQGLGTGAFNVLLIRITKKRFSATQYALFSSLFAVPRMIAGPISGFFVDATNWTTYFWFTIFAGIPGMVLLARFSPLGVREPEFEVAHFKPKPRLSFKEVLTRGVFSALAGFALIASAAATLDALKLMKSDPNRGFDFMTSLTSIFVPSDINTWLVLIGIVIMACVIGLAGAAISAARHGAGEDVAKSG